MKKKLTMLIVGGMLCLVYPAYAQRPQPLKLNQKIPNKLLEARMPVLFDQGGKRDSLKLSDYQGKVILLDFWASWCTICINKFPALDAIQREFSSDLQIVLVNSKNTRDKIDQIIQRMKGDNKFGFSTTLPSIYGDTVLNALFPLTYLPHYVWLGPKGDLIAITDAELVSRDFVKVMIEGVKSKQLMAKKPKGS
ncbi:MAG: TlpA family protein disulfide reductase [Pedobacter sp.]|nr:MAG: TlpA family protein disulfide reductase [Pedobacter sp.]